MSFLNELKQFKVKVGNNLDIFNRSICLSIGNSLVALSPWDTGRFRANWRFEIGSEDLTTDESTDQSGGLALGRLIATVNGVKHGQSFYLTNNLPYAIPLEYGHSDKQQNGIVRQTAALFDEIIKDASQGLK